MRTRKYPGLLIVALILVALCFPSGRPTLAGREAPEFGGRPKPSLVPLLWTQGQPSETIRRAVREVAESGNTGFVWESRPHPDYLGPGWWRDLGTAVEEAKRLGLEVWIFDEWMYPSGIAGGRVIGENPAFTHPVLIERSRTLEGPLPEQQWAIAKDLTPNEHIVSVAAFPEPFKPGQKVIDLGQAAVGGSLKTVRWAVPEGRWRLAWCVSRTDPLRQGWRMDTMIDVLNPEAVAAFIRLTHEATYAHFAADFGKTIKGFFSDETGFRNVTSYKSLPGTPGMPMPWSPAFPGYFQRLKGYDPRPLLAALWYDLGPDGRAARFDLMDAYSKCLAETFFKPQQEWCRAHGVRLIGHLVEDNGADFQLGYGPGHWFRAMEFFDVPGIDVVGYQVTPGLDSGTNAWVRGNSAEGWDQEFFQFGLPAMARGAALAKGVREIFSEAFGANGWSEGLRMVKWIGDWHIVNGFNLISPHAFTMKFNDPDCPPHFNRMSGNPQWRSYGVWAEYFKRLQAISLSSVPEYEVAVLYTAESAWAGPAQTVSPAVRLLETRQVRTAVVPYEVFARGGRLKAGRWNYNGQSFKTVVLPCARFVPADVVRRLADFAETGGRAVIIDGWPEGSVDGRSDATVARDVARLRSAPAAALVALPELPPFLSPLAGENLSPAPPSMVLARRKGDGGEWILVHNRSLDSGYSGRLLIRGVKGPCARYDAEKNVYYQLPCISTADGLAVDITVPPYGLWCLELSATRPVQESPPVLTVREEMQPEWEAFPVDEDGHEGPSLGLIKGLENWRRWKGLENYAGTIRYRTAVNLPAPAAMGIDAGRVEEIAELRVNGRSAGTRLCPPYIWDISELVRPGKNVIEIDVTNTAFARWTDPFSRGDAASGLLGPVSILRKRD
jgi:hypothetical protein